MTERIAQRETREWQRWIELIHSQVNILELKPKDSTMKGYYECITSRDDLREKIISWLNWTKNSGKRSLKDSERAKCLKEEGNGYFKKKDYPLSIKNYTESARHATLDNDDFCTAIGNRSAALFHTRRYRVNTPMENNYAEYLTGMLERGKKTFNVFLAPLVVKSCVTSEESLRDIELAIVCGYPEKMSWKLHLRAAQCHLELGEVKLAEKELEKLEISVDKNIDEPMKNRILKRAKEVSSEIVRERREKLVVPPSSNETKDITNPEDMLPKNIEFPFASASLIRKKCRIRGRYVVAGKRIKKGDVLFVEKPFAWVPVTHGNDVSVCAHCCGSMDDTLVPCRGCLDALYCCATCWKDAWPYHQWECPGYHMALWQQIGVSHLAFKIFLVSTTTSDLVWFNDVQKLVTNFELKSPDDLLGLGIASLMLTTYIEKYTNFLSLVDIEKCLVEKFYDKSLSFDVDLSTIEGKKLYVGSMIFRHSLQMLANAYAVTRIGESSESAGRALIVEEQQRIAAGAYPSASMLNHSCDPTVIHTFWRNWLIVKALKNISEGQEIFNCYGPYFKRVPKSKRREDLQEQYCFYCECEACENPLFDNYTDRFDGLKCPKCCGSSFRFPHSSLHRCFDCGATSDVTFDDALQKAAKLSDQGMHLTDIDKWEEAIPCFDKCLAIRERYMYKHNEDIAITLDALGQCHASNGRWLASISYLEKSLAAIEERYGTDSIEAANELNKITDVCFQYLRRTLSPRTEEYRNTFIKTRKYVDRALAIISLTGGPWNERYQEVNDKRKQLSGMLQQLRI